MTNIQLDDTGDYVCEVTVGSRVIKQLNAIEVQGELDRKILTFIDYLIDRMNVLTVN